MASAIFTPPYLSNTSSPTLLRKPTLYVSLSTSHISNPKNPIFRSLTWVPQLGLASFSTWSGLKPNGFSISLQSLRLVRRRKCKGRGVYASLFGVGAPEVLVIGVVALLVFGPKGLAEVAKNLGQTLRAFQPTIKELQEVSREFKSTLEKEIGLDELKNLPQSNYTSNIETLSSSPLLDATPENSQATETAPVVTTEDSQETSTAPVATVEDSQATAPIVTPEDSQLTANPTNGSPTSKAYSSEDILKITEQQSPASTSTPVQDTVREVDIGTPSTEKSKSEI